MMLWLNFAQKTEKPFNQLISMPITPIFEFVNTKIFPLETPEESSFFNKLLQPIFNFFAYCRAENDRINMQKKHYPHGTITHKPIHLSEEKIDPDFQQAKLYRIMRAATQYLLDKKVISEPSEFSFYKDLTCSEKTCAGQARTWMLITRSLHDKTLATEQAQKTQIFFWHALYTLDVLSQNYIVRRTNKKKKLRAELRTLEASKLTLKGSSKANQRKEINSKVLDVQQQILAIEIDVKDVTALTDLLKKQEEAAWKKAGLQFLRCEKIYLQKHKNKTQFTAAIRKKLIALFRDKAVSDILVSLQNLKSRAGHQILIQSEELRVYDSKCGEVSYKDQKSQLIDDLCKRILHRKIDKVKFNLVGRTALHQLVVYKQHGIDRAL
jgi:hypothetical protein